MFQNSNRKIKDLASSLFKNSLKLSYHDEKCLRTKNADFSCRMQTLVSQQLIFTQLCTISW